jgi:ribosomal-protein-serine acetyltransferase
MFSYKIDEDTELRLIEPRHAKQLYDLIEGNRQHLKEWLGWLKEGHSLEDTQNFIKRNLIQLSENNGFTVCIWHKGEIAGQVGYSYIDWKNRKSEIGYWLGASFQGKGLITQSCRALINHAFNELKLNRIEIHCGVENGRSRRIPVKLGFREEGVCRQAGWLYDHFIDIVIYGLLESEWQEQSKK